jgi:hypothetical protein
MSNDGAGGGGFQQGQEGDFSNETAVPAAVAAGGMFFFILSKISAGFEHNFKLR